MNSLIVAIDNNGGISKKGENTLRWDIKLDTQFFQDVTKRDYNGKKNILIMGKNTYESLNLKSSLPGRIIIVVSSTLQINIPDVYFEPTFNQSYQKAIDLNEGIIIFCGGKNIYEQAMPLVNIIYLTQIHDDYQCDNILDINADHFHVYSQDTFRLKDTKNDKDVDVTFIKMYLSEPDHFKRIEEHQYLDLLKKILFKGELRKTRNALTYSLFSHTMEFNLQNSFPLMTTKRMFLKGIFFELMWFISGSTNSKVLEEQGVNIWKANTSREFLDSMRLNHYDEGDTGPLYGFNFNYYGLEYKGMNEDYNNKGGINQFEYCLNLLKTDPTSRRIIMSSFNPATANQCVLYPCHSNILQWYVEDDNKLSLACYNRSQDVPMANNWNHVMAALLVYMFCEILTNQGYSYTPSRLIIHMGDVHVYKLHQQETLRQILRDPHPFPTLSFNRKVTDLNDFKFEDLVLKNYKCYPTIPMKMVA